jgi:hypothetical protein
VLSKNVLEPDGIRERLLAERAVFLGVGHIYLAGGNISYT